MESSPKEPWQQWVSALVCLPVKIHTALVFERFSNCTSVSDCLYLSAYLSPLSLHPFLPFAPPPHPPIIPFVLPLPASPLSFEVERKQQPDPKCQYQHTCPPPPPQKKKNTPTPPTTTTTNKQKVYSCTEHV